MSDRVISVKGLSKTFSSVQKQPGIAGSLRALISRQKSHTEAVKEVSFDIAPGELVGFLGPNGAGKTTTLKMLTGILHPTSGEARVLGYRPFDRKPELLRQIALVMGNKNQLWWDLPAWDSFIVLRELYGVPKADFDRRLDRLLSDLQISDKVNTQVRKMSLGERMKCELVAALLYGPKVIFLDEPTIGLDLMSQKRIRDFLISHYHVTRRSDSPFWNYCRTMEIPATLQHKLDLFAANGRFERDGAELFAEQSWIQVLIGQGLQPRGYHPIADTRSTDDIDEFLGNVEGVIEKCVKVMPSQAEYIAAHCAAPRA
jgi:ABC-type Na+ transport system ATPase subunit NatA